MNTITLTLTEPQMEALLSLCANECEGLAEHSPDLDHALQEMRVLVDVLEAANAAH